ncbi:MAG: DUF3298 and DUF4163 domain-containing protein [Firmicutes bacterium]|nr:DUF3298 and DUF4163 domain-containing protein [Bacillota bacterium]
MATTDRNLQALLKQAGTTYPKAVNLPGKVRSKVNSAIKKAAYDAIPDYDPGTSVSEAVSSYKTTLNMKGILSLRFEDYFYPEMAAHGVTGVSSVTVALKTGRVYEFDQLFVKDSNYQVILDQIIHAQIVAEQIPLLKPFAGVGPDEDYYLTPDSLVIYYQPYVYTPGAYGVLEFKIPYSKIIGVIDPDGAIGKVLG